jgi:hypothetical protein
MRSGVYIGKTGQKNGIMGTMGSFAPEIAGRFRHNQEQPILHVKVLAFTITHSSRLLPSTYFACILYCTIGHQEMV